MHRRGFSLVELLVILAVVVLFLAVLLPALARAREAPNWPDGTLRIHTVGANPGPVYPKDPFHRSVNPVTQNGR